MKNPQYMDDEMPDERFQVGDIVEVLFEGEAEYIGIDPDSNDLLVKIKSDGVTVSASPNQVFRKQPGVTRQW